MDLSLTTSYDATPEEVFAIITDATFQEQVCQRLHAPSYDVAVGDSGDDMVLRVRWETSPTGVPSVARPFVGTTLILAQTKIWHPADSDGAREADVEGEAAGSRVRLSGRTYIVPTGRSTTQTFDLHVTTSLPALGDRLERVVTDAVRTRLETKFELAWSWIAGSLWFSLPGPRSAESPWSGRLVGPGNTIRAGRLTRRRLRQQKETRLLQVHAKVRHSDTRGLSALTDRSQNSGRSIGTRMRGAATSLPLPARTPPPAKRWRRAGCGPGASVDLASGHQDRPRLFAEGNDGDGCW